MMLVLHYIAAIFISLLPDRYRDRHRLGADLHRAAALSGLAQSAVSFAVLFVRYVDFIQRELERLGGAAVTGGREEALAVPAVQHGMGFVALLEFIFHLLSLLLLYLALEGLVRFLAGAVTGEVVGTMPLYAAAWAYERFKRARATPPPAE